MVLNGKWRVVSGFGLNLVKQIVNQARVGN